MIERLPSSNGVRKHYTAVCRHAPGAWQTTHCMVAGSWSFIARISRDLVKAAKMHVFQIPGVRLFRMAGARQMVMNIHKVPKAVCMNATF